MSRRVPKGKPAATVRSEPAREVWRAVEERTELHSRKRRLILETAAMTFAECGYHETSIDQIAARLEVTKPTIYYYVKNKDDLLYQITQTALDDLDRAVSCEPAQDLSALDRLERFFKIYARSITSDFGVCIALISDRALSTESRRHLRTLKKGFETRVQGIIEDGHKDGSVEVENPRLFVNAMFGAFNWLPQWFSTSGAMSLDDLSAVYFAIFRRALVKSPGNAANVPLTLHRTSTRGEIGIAGSL